MDSELRKQAYEVSEALRTLMRQFSTIDTEGPTKDLPVAQIRVCGILHDGQRTMSALAKELRISLSAVTQIADRLEKSLLVERITENDDHRVKCLRLTEHGREAVETRRNGRLERVIDTLKGLSAEERSVALEGLRVLMKVAKDHSVQRPTAAVEA